MRLHDFIKAESKFFLKSVYGPVNREWPAMSYTLPQLKKYLEQHYRPGLDFLILTGTLGKDTEPEHRGRLLSALTIDLTRSYRTEQIVPAESWRISQERYPGQWEYSLGIVQAWSFVPPLSSFDILPRSYPLMGQYPYRGSVKEIEPDELRSLLDLEILEETLPVAPAMKPALTMQALLRDRILNENAVRLAELICHRVDASGSLQTGVAPTRTIPMPPSELVLMVAEKLRQEPLCCALCGGLMILRPSNQLLQPSADRLDSAIGSYGPENFQLAHLACNLAKNKFSTEQFQEWLRIASAQAHAEAIV